MPGNRLMFCLVGNYDVPVMNVNYPARSTDAIYTLGYRQPIMSHMWETKIPSQGLIRAFSEYPATFVPGSISGSGVARKNGNTRTFQAFGPITDSASTLVDARRVRRGIGVEKCTLQ